MNEKKNLFYYLGEWWEARNSNPQLTNRTWSRWLPTPGNVVFTLLVIGALIVTQNVWAKSSQSALNAPGPSATTVNYQGRLADNGGTPLDGSYGMSFALYDAATVGNLIWGPESHTAVPVSEGLFSIGLGSQTSGGIPTNTWNGDRYLEITVGGETLEPRELIRSVPIAGMALTAQNADTAQTANLALTVPDGAINQTHAPSLIESANGNNEIIRSGNVVFSNGSDAGGNMEITYPCFPNRVRTFVAINGDVNARSSKVIGHNGGGQCSTTIVIDPPTANPIRINWIAIGN